MLNLRIILNLSCNSVCLILWFIIDQILDLCIFSILGFNIFILYLSKKFHLFILLFKVIHVVR